MARWVGIDEAGYGPNLGPLVMTAVVAEGPDDPPPDVWADLPQTVDRAGGDPDKLWVDDSKRVYRGGVGLDRLEAASLVALAATMPHVPATLVGVLDALGADLSRPHGRPPCGLELWWSGIDPPLPHPSSSARCQAALERAPLAGAPWKIVAVRSAVVDPQTFNALLSVHSSKSVVQFAILADLLRAVWDLNIEEPMTSVRADKHGGRHYYLEPLARHFPGLWIERGAEGPAFEPVHAPPGRPPVGPMPATPGRFRRWAGRAGVDGQQDGP